MSKADGGLRKVLQRFLPKPEWRWTPVETGGTHQGVPDSYFLHRATGDHGWVECKKTDGWAVKVEPHQVSWISAHAAAGVRCSVAVRASGAGSAAGHGDALWLLQGSAIELVAEHGLRLPARHVLGCWHGDPKIWNWDEIGRLIRRGG